MIVADRRRGRRESDVALLAGCADGLSADAVSFEAVVGDVAEVMRLMGCAAGLLAWAGPEGGALRVHASFGLPRGGRAEAPEDLVAWARAEADGAPPAGLPPDPIGTVAARLEATAHVVPLVRAGELRGLLGAVRALEVSGAERHESAIFRLLGHLAGAALEGAERSAREVRTHFAAGHEATLRVLGRELARARALEVPCAFVRIRLLGVGRLNSRRGLAAGDAVFEAVRAAIDRTLPEVADLSLVGRHLADSWAVVLPGYTRPQAEAAALTIADAARRRIAETAEPLEDGAPAADVATAVAVLPEDGRHVVPIVRAVSDDRAFGGSPPG